MQNSFKRAFSRVTLLGLVSVLLFGVVGVNSASAQGESEGRSTEINSSKDSTLFTVTSLNASREGRVRADINWSGSLGALRDGKVSVNGERVDGVEVSTANSSAPQSFVFIFDTSEAAVESGLTSASTKIVGEWLNSRTEEERNSQPVAFYAAGSSPVALLSYTTDLQRQLFALTRVGAGVGKTNLDPLNKNSALWDTVQQALLTAPPIGGSSPRSMIVISSRGNTVESTTSSRRQVLGEAQLTSTQMFFSLGPTQTQSAGLGEVANQSGGILLPATSREQAEANVDVILELASQRRYRLDIPVPPTQESENNFVVLIEVGELKTGGAVPRGGVVNGPGNMAVPTDGGFTFNFFNNRFVVIIGILFGALAISGIVFVVAQNFMVRESFDDQLRTYLADSLGTSDLQSLPDSEKQRIVRNILLQRASTVADSITKRTGFSEKLDDMLERADMKVKPREFMMIYFISVPVSILIGIIFQNAIFFFGILVIALLAPIAVVNQKISRREKRFADQLPDTLQLLASSLRAGNSIPQALEAASKEMPSPMDKEISRIVNEMQLGGNLTVGIDSVAKKMNNRDFEWVSMGVSIQQEIGGNLAELLDSVAKIILERNKLARDIRTLTAEGKLSALVLILLPIGILVGLSFLNPDYAGVLTGTTMGRIALFISTIMMVGGWIWMQKIIKIKY